MIGTEALVESGLEPGQSLLAVVYSQVQPGIQQGRDILLLRPLRELLQDSSGLNFPSRNAEDVAEQSQKERLNRPGFPGDRIS